MDTKMDKFWMPAHFKIGNLIRSNSVALFSSSLILSWKSLNVSCVKNSLALGLISKLACIYIWAVCFLHRIEGAHDQGVG